MLTVSSELLCCFLVALIVIGLVLVKFSSKTSNKQLIEVGRPHGYPLIGNVLDLLPNVFMDSCERFANEYGKIVEIYVLGKRMFIISDLAICKEILFKRPKVFRRVKSFDYGAKILNIRSGLFNIHGPEWSRIRKITSPALAKHHLMKKVDAMLTEALSLCTRLTPLADGKTEVNMKDESFLYTLRVICHTAFGLELKGEFAEYFLGKQFPTDLFASFKFILETATFPLPFWIWKLIPSLYQIEKEAVEGDKRMSILIAKLIANKRRQLELNPSENNSNSVIDILISNERSTETHISTTHNTIDISNNIDNTANNIQLASQTLSPEPLLHTANETHDTTNNNISDNEILANVKTFFAAGSETTSVTISWAVYFIAQNPTLVVQIQNEVDAFYVAYKNVENFNKPLTSDEIWAALSQEHMPLTHAVVKECLRIYSPAPMLFIQLESENESYILNNGLEIKPKDEIIVEVEVCHLDPEIFPSPKLFNPHRWLTKDTAVLNKMDTSFMAFGYGPRVCPGQSLANLEAVIGISSLLHHFDFTLACPVSEIKRVFVFTAQPTKMPVYLMKRDV